MPISGITLLYLMARTPTRIRPSLLMAKRFFAQFGINADEGVELEHSLAQSAGEPHPRGV